ncbi:MAG: hypothetical protein IT291_08370 [Deltaproteobacteria bacterium]|nr:hypothetical protein [Deltaproteobacteria bacterium]
MRVFVILIVVFCVNFVFVPISHARETRRIDISGTLDSSSSFSYPPSSSGLSFSVLSSAAQFETSVGIIDSIGSYHNIRFYFFHTAANHWEVETYVDGGEVIGGSAGSPVRVSALSLEFNLNGSRSNYSPFGDGLAVAGWLNGAVQSNIGLHLDEFMEIVGSSMITSFFQDGCVSNCPQNGGFDYDGDAIDDMAIWRPELGMWAIRRSSLSDVLWKQWGLPGDYPIAGDYTGDSKSDLVVWRPSNGNWYICSSDNNFDCTWGTVYQFGLPGDRPLGGDFDGDGIFDLAVWRPIVGFFIYQSSRTGTVIVQQWGLPTDIPLGTKPSD